MCSKIDQIREQLSEKWEDSNRKSEGKCIKEWTIILWW